MSIETLPEVEATIEPEPVAATAPVRRWPREAEVVAWLVIVAGGVFRVRAWLHWRSLWLDELYLTHSIVTRGIYRLLFQPLDYWQGAPAGFLVIERLCVDLFGAGERSLRLPSLLFGLAALPLFYFVARRLLSLRATLIAVLLFACLRPLVYYSAEVKQYSDDVTVTLAVLLCAVSVRGATSRRILVIYLAVGGAAIFFSHPAVFILAATWVVLLVELVRTDRRSAAVLVLGGAVWAGLEWINVRFFLWPLMRGPAHDGLVLAWQQLGGFPPYGPNLAAAWVWTSFRGIMGGWATMYLTAADLGMFAAVVGAAGLLLGKRRMTGFLLLLPLGLAVVVAFRRQYPLADRLALYLVPILTLLIAEGVDQIWGHSDGDVSAQGWGRAAVGVMAAVMLAGGSVTRCWHEFWYPAGREETKSIYQWVRRNWRPGDVLVLSHMAEQSYDYYAPQTGLAGLEQLWTSGGAAAAAEGAAQPRLEASAQGIAAEPWYIRAFNGGRLPAGSAKGYVVLEPDFTNNPALYLDASDELMHPDPAWHWPPAHRVWCVFTHYLDENGRRVDDLCVMELDRQAEMKVRHLEEGADAYLYELGGTPSAYLQE